ncbi:hypothetical protein [Polaribacter atrinae]|uniref:Uncharacterized protein n=1 Tax=Polaribacter atrinae TaxID=1333662 RepID=A0A176T7G1_9FLAO|nr:hypothetical protein [Polaribacter atrinae]OAD43838.1 hypothetical protein LPB303_13090 [Polaribacter atrinae]
MASAFWTLEDGRGFARRWSGMAYMLELITNELKHIAGAEDFYNYLEWFVIREEKGDEYNGFGGFIRNDENIMFDIDLRTFTPANRAYFWGATQKALIKLIKQKDEKNEGIIFLLTTLLDMHKRIKKGEDPMELNHMNNIESEPTEKLGPGWK